MTQQASPLGNPSSASGQGRDPHPPARAAGLKLVALLLAFVSLRVLLSEMSGDGFTDSWAAAVASDPVLALLELATVCAGVAAAFALCSANRWAVRGYLIWMLLFFSVTLVSEARSEPTAWRLVAGVALIAVLPLAGAVYVRRTLV